MKTNLTLKIDAKLIREAKVLAARTGTSVSKLLAQQLEEVIRRDRGYDAARRRALDRLAKAGDLGWTRPTSRDELHER